MNIAATKHMEPYFIDQNPRHQTLHGIGINSVLDMQRLRAICRAAADLRIRVAAGSDCFGRFTIMLAGGIHARVVAGAGNQICGRSLIQFLATLDNPSSGSAEEMYREVIECAMRHRMEAPSKILMLDAQIWWSPGQEEVDEYDIAIEKAGNSIAAAIPTWIGWSTLPADLCSVVAEYLDPLDHFFEQQLQLATRLLPPQRE